MEFFCAFQIPFYHRLWHLPDLPLCLCQASFKAFEGRDSAWLSRCSWAAHTGSAQCTEVAITLALFKEQKKHWCALSLVNWDLDLKNAGLTRLIGYHRDVSPNDKQFCCQVLCITALWVTPKHPGVFKEAPFWDQQHWNLGRARHPQKSEASFKVSKINLRICMEPQKNKP